MPRRSDSLGLLEYIRRLLDGRRANLRRMRKPTTLGLTHAWRSFGLGREHSDYCSSCKDLRAAELAGRGRP